MFTLRQSNIEAQKQSPIGESFADGAHIGKTPDTEPNEIYHQTHYYRYGGLRLYSNYELCHSPVPQCMIIIVLLHSTIHYAEWFFLVHHW